MMSRSGSSRMPGSSSASSASTPSMAASSLSSLSALNASSGALNSSASNKVSGELFALAYGGLVAQILRDHDNNADDTNRILERMGHNIGVRIVEDFLCRTKTSRCGDLRETAERLQQAFKLYLNVSPSVTTWSSASDEFSLVFDANPLGEFVELPDHCYNLRYANLLAGCVRGALEMVHIEVAVWFVQDTLKGDSVTEMRLKFIRRIEDSVPAGED